MNVKKYKILKKGRVPSPRRVGQVGGAGSIGGCGGRAVSAVPMLCSSPSAPSSTVPPPPPRVMPAWSAQTLWASYRGIVMLMLSQGAH